VLALHCIFLLGTSKLLRSKRLSKLLGPFLAIADLVEGLSRGGGRYAEMPGNLISTRSSALSGLNCVT
jgi:hypothetical protein